MVAMGPGPSRAAPRAAGAHPRPRQCRDPRAGGGRGGRASPRGHVCPVTRHNEVLVDVEVVVAPAWSQVCVVFHSPENSTQEVPVSPPPQAAPPVWEWEKRGAGRSGSAHSRHPSARSSSTEARGASPSPGPARPPLTRITELTE